MKKKKIFAKSKSSENGRRGNACTLFPYSKENTETENHTIISVNSFFLSNLCKLEMSNIRKRKRKITQFSASTMKEKGETIFESLQEITVQRSNVGEYRHVSYVSRTVPCLLVQLIFSLSVEFSNFEESIFSMDCLSSFEMKGENGMCKYLFNILKKKQNSQQFTYYKRWGGNGRNSFSKKYIALIMLYLVFVVWNSYVKPACNILSPMTDLIFLFE